MAEIAIDTYWRLLDCQEQKEPSRRGLRRIRCNLRRARSDRCHERRTHPDRARRRAVLDQIFCREIEEVEIDDPAEPGPEPVPLGYSQSAYQYEERRRHEAEEELLEEARTSGVLERVRAMKLSCCPMYFEEQMELLESDLEIGDHTSALLIENFEREALGQLAAA